jgi:hypothetical protein
MATNGLTVPFLDEIDRAGGFEALRSETTDF